MTDEESYPVGKEPCPKCREQGNDRSGDNLAVYSDGHKFCFACKHYVKGDQELNYTQPVQREWTPLQGEYEAIPSRGIEEKTCRKFGYTIARRDSGAFHVASVYKNRELIGQHVRQENPKDFRWLGSPRGAELYGQHLWERGGKKIVVTEGEIDAMTVYQVNNGWPVVSLPNGVQSAVRSVKDNLEFLSSYGEIIIMFDMDEPGQTAAKEVAALMPPGKAKIASLPLKDANACLTEGQSKQIVSAIWQASPYSPDEIMHVSSIVRTDIDLDSVIPYPWESLNKFLVGNAKSDLTLWASGTGSGKSTILRELANYHLEAGRAVGMIMLEESPDETLDDLISLRINSPVRVVRAMEIMNHVREKEGKTPMPVEFAGFDQDEYDLARSELNGTSLYMYNHMGRKAMDNILSRIDYMAVSLGVDVIILDHITALANAMLTEENQNERILIDNVMSHLESLAERTGVRIHIVSQLKKSDKAHEEGSRGTLQDLKGAGSLASVPDSVIMLERNRQDPDEVKANTTTVRVLKNRMTGRVGPASAFYYDRATGRLRDVEFVEEDGKIVPNIDPFKEESG
jgi:twinkle protein